MNCVWLLVRPAPTETSADTYVLNDPGAPLVTVNGERRQLCRRVRRQADQ